MSKLFKIAILLFFIPAFVAIHLFTTYDLYNITTIVIILIWLYFNGNIAGKERLSKKEIWMDTWLSWASLIIIIGLFYTKWYYLDPSLKTNSIALDFAIEKYFSIYMQFLIAVQVIDAVLGTICVIRSYKRGLQNEEIRKEKQKSNLTRAKEDGISKGIEATETEEFQIGRNHPVQA